MPMALLLPWCRITQPYMVGEIQLLPFTRDAPDIQRADDIDQDAYQAINRLLAPYRDLAGQSIERAAIVTYNGRKIIDELSEEEIATARELVEMACFSALAQRNLFSDRGPYCNRDVFTLYAQKFAIPIEMIAIETAKSRGAGRVISGWSIDKLCITVPAHVAPSSEVTIDDNLLGALVSYRTRANADTWQRWANALSSYNLANTDSDSVSLATDWTLMCGSFQLVLDADSKSEDVGAKFASAVAPQTDMLSSESARNSDRFQKEPRLALREEWMREFYRIRGNLAHGWLEPKQPAAWSAAEHLTLARLTFPLLAKTRLATCGLYTMTEDDEIWLSRLEQVADSQDLTKGYEMEREMPSIKTEREYRRASEKLKAALNVPAHAESLGLTRKRDSLDSESGTANNDEAEKRTDA